MLLSLSIRNIALMDEMQVDFSSGLHVLTGETGAGKSILVDAVTLLLGGRAQKELIRKGEEKARVEGVFDVSDCPAVKELLKEQELDEGEELIPAHRYFAAEGSEALIRIYAAEAAGFVDGNYLAQLSGDFDISERFLDLEGHWGRDQVLTLAEAGLVNGMDAHHFEPDRRVTRAMFVTVLGRMHGVHEDFIAPLSFIDVQEADWFAPYVTWASLSGIVTGYEDGTFAPNKEITREQMALILIRYCEAYDCRLEEREYETPFTDEGSISPWALDAVLKSRRCGLINGRDDGSFDPSGTATRAEMCAVMARLMEKTKETGSESNDDTGEDQPLG